MKDSAIRERILGDITTSFVVEAGAGTGKTTALVGRMVTLLRAGVATTQSLVALTFTERAAAEMKLRLSVLLERERQRLAPENVEYDRLDVALKNFEAIEIGTIHGFCASVLRRFPREAALDPLFSVATESEQKAAYNAVFERWFQQQLALPSAGVARVLRKRSAARFGSQDGSSPRQLLWDAGRKLLDVRDFTAAFERPVYAREPALDAIMVTYAAFAALAPRAVEPEHYFSESIRYLASFHDEIHRIEDTRGERDYDAIEECLRRAVSGPRKNVWQYKGWTARFCDGLTTRDVAQQRDALLVAIKQLLRIADADLAACLQQELGPLVLSYVSELSRSGKLDFLDLLLRTKTLFLEHVDVRTHVQDMYTHVLVDEGQDLDPLQVEIVLSVISEAPKPGRSFLVGDPKQSIYRFRRAEIALYESVKRRLLTFGAELLHLSTNFRSSPDICEFANSAFSSAMKPGAGQASYVRIEAARAAPGSSSEATLGVPRLSIVGLPIPEPYSPQTGRISNYFISTSFPEAVGAFVAWLLEESGVLVTGPDGREVPVLARHVCLLFRRLSAFGDDVASPYVRALESRRIPHALLGGKGFYGREEVVALASALAAVEWPDDELSVYATLRGPLFGFTDEALLVLRERTSSSLNPLRTVAAEHCTELTAPVASALALLGDLHCRRNARPVGETLAELLLATRAHATFALWPSGDQALANVFQVVDEARTQDLRGMGSFRAFVVQMQHERERGAHGEGAVVEESTDGVRLMTVHKAKGLEFPVVILVDPACSAIAETASRYVDAARNLCAVPLAYAAPLELSLNEAAVLSADRDESVRIAYVAATRARDLLVVPVLGDGRLEDSWLRALGIAAYPSKASMHAPAEIPGVAFLGRETVLSRPAKAKVDTAQSLRPGLHRPEVGAHTVAIWDPSALKLQSVERVGLRQQSILAPDPGGVHVRAGAEAFSDWRTAQRTTLAAGARPNYQVVTMTALGRELALFEAESLVSASAISSSAAMTGGASVLATRALLERIQPYRNAEIESLREASESHALPSGLRRPGGARFGTLVHQVLAAVDEQCSTNASVTEAAEVAVPVADPGAQGGAAATASALAKWFGRSLGATLEECQAAAQVVGCFLRSPHARCSDARVPPERFFEHPVTLNLDDGRVAEGAVDLVYRAPDSSWVLVDFKTDAPPNRGELVRPEYALQMALYACAIHEATGLRVQSRMVFL
jgi:ATP-dependent helicase/nuclease subunit A